MHIQTADRDLSAFVTGILVDQMVAALLERPCNLRDEAAVAIRLSCAGFGGASIAALADEARCSAIRRQERCELIEVGA